MLGFVCSADKPLNESLIPFLQGKSLYRRDFPLEN
nr:MAG TPA: hypothetical protein [Caudoviricetes sp.]